VDVAATSSNHSPSGVSEPGEFLAGAGVGAELLIRSNFRARLDWATALKSNDSTTTSVEAGDHEFHMLFQILY
jgi:hemolysin activation/secretion protein